MVIISVSHIIIVIEYLDPPTCRKLGVWGLSKYSFSNTFYCIHDIIISYMTVLLCLEDVICMRCVSCISVFRRHTLNDKSFNFTKCDENIGWNIHRIIESNFIIYYWFWFDEIVSKISECNCEVFIESHFSTHCTW